MHDFELDQLRRQLANGEPADGDAVRRLLDDVVALRSRVNRPTNVHLEAWVDVDEPSTWRSSTRSCAPRFTPDRRRMR